MSSRSAPATRRINQGRGHRYVLDGTKCDGVTTVIKTALAAPALVGWAARETAEAVVNRREILTMLTDDEIRDFLRGAPYRIRDEAANRGTEVHRLAAQMAEGQEIEVPDALLGRVDAYLDFWHRWEPQEVMVERTVINRRYRYMGTFDMLCLLDGRRTLVDIKTSKGVYPDTAFQLAAYGHAESVFATDYAQSEAEIPMPEPEAYAVLWLGSDSWELYPFDIGEREFRTFLYLLETARWIKQRAGTDRDQASNPVMGEPLARPRQP